MMEFVKLEVLSAVTPCGLENLPAMRKDLLPQSSPQKDILLLSRWRHHIYVKPMYISNTRHGVTSQEAVLLSVCFCYWCEGT
jgi:hypothetical protein